MEEERKGYSLKLLENRFLSVEIEERKMRILRFIVDQTQATLMQSNLTLQEACKLMENTKKSALKLFPDKEHTYDLIYTPRFSRIISERFKLG